MKSKTPQIQVLESLPDFRPLYVSAASVDKVVLGVSRKTFSNWRSEKRGPRFFLVGGKPYYRLDDLESYFGANPVETLNLENR